MSTTPVNVILTEEQKLLQTFQIGASAAQQIAAVWGHETVASLIAELPALAPLIAGFVDAIIAAKKK